jgi:hypothetical protein
LHYGNLIMAGAVMGKSSIDMIEDLPEARLGGEGCHAQA